jgi:hypothetical protein
MYESLVTYLRIHQVKDKISSPEAHKIGDGIFDLVFPNFAPHVHLCVDAFSRIIGVSEKKVEKAAFRAVHGAESSTPLKLRDTFKEAYAPKSAAIITFLNWYYEKMSIELDDAVATEIQSESGGNKTKVKYAIGCYDRGELFNEFDIRCGECNASPTWFYVIWKNRCPELHLMHDRACSDCDSLVAQIRKAEKDNVHAVAGLRYQLEEHRKLDKRMKDYVESKVAKSRWTNSDLTVLFSDHWGSKKLIACKSSLAEYKKIAVTNSILNLHSSGIFDATQKQSDYMIYNQPYEETTNTILNHFQFFFEQHEDRKFKSLYFVSDTHSTQRSNLLIAYFDYLVRILKVFGENGKVVLVYYMRGHHCHDGDRAHAKPQELYYKALKSGDTIGDPQQFCQIMSSLRNYRFYWKLRFLDFGEVFAKKFKTIPAISSTHLFKITTKGIFTKGI